MEEKLHRNLKEMVKLNLLLTNLMAKFHSLMTVKQIFLMMMVMTTGLLMTGLLTMGMLIMMLMAPITTTITDMAEEMEVTLLSKNSKKC